MAKIKRKFVRGFTLIELLVVISIIGILSSVVLVSLKNSRSKAGDAKIKSQLRSVATAAALYSTNNGNKYGSVEVAGNEAAGATIGTGCAVPGSVFADSNVSPGLKASVYPLSANGTGKCTVPPTRDSYTVTAQLSDGTYWCVDAKGATVALTSKRSMNSYSSCVS